MKDVDALSNFKEKKEKKKYGDNHYFSLLCFQSMFQKLFLQRILYVSLRNVAKMKQKICMI